MKAEVVWWECAVAGLAFGLGFLFHKLLSSSASTSSSSSTAQSAQDGRNHRKIAQDLFELIGDTPMIKLQSLSNATGCTILAKCEFMNPVDWNADDVNPSWDWLLVELKTMCRHYLGSIKDRVAKSIIHHAQLQGRIKPGDTIVEATAGSTGISLALCGLAKGYKMEVFLPDNVSGEKVALLKAVHATVTLCPVVPPNLPQNFIHAARRKCLVSSGEGPKYFFADQFDTASNIAAHLQDTAREIWEQCDGKVDGVVMGAGTGGTISGIVGFLKKKNPSLLAYLVDPPGSGLSSLLDHGVMFDARDRMVVEPPGARSIYEGVGSNRLSENFKLRTKGSQDHGEECYTLDGFFKCSEQEGVDMIHYLLEKEGLFLGGSSGLNCVGAVKLARLMRAQDEKEGKNVQRVIVTILPDGGHRFVIIMLDARLISDADVVMESDTISRYLSNLYNPQWLHEHGIVPQPRLPQ